MLYSNFNVYKVYISLLDKADKKAADLFLRLCVHDDEVAEALGWLDNIDDPNVYMSQLEDGAIEIAIECGRALTVITLSETEILKIENF